MEILYLFFMCFVVGFVLLWIIVKGGIAKDKEIADNNRKIRDQARPGFKKYNYMYCEDETCQACKAAKEIDVLTRKIRERGQVIQADYDEMHRLNKIILS